MKIPNDIRNPQYEGFVKDLSRGPTTNAEISLGLSDNVGDYRGFHADRTFGANWHMKLSALER